MIYLGFKDAYFGKRLNNLIHFLINDFTNTKKEPLTFKWLSAILFIIDFTFFKKNGSAFFGLKYEITQSEIVRIINAFKTYDHKLCIENHYIESVKIYDTGIYSTGDFQYELEYFSDEEIDQIDEIINYFINNDNLSNDYFCTISRAYSKAYNNLLNSDLKIIPVKYDDEFSELENFSVYIDDEEILSEPAKHHVINKMLSKIKSV
jgi:hypothetical protein